MPTLRRDFYFEELSEEQRMIEDRKIIGSILNLNFLRGVNGTFSATIFEATEMLTVKSADIFIVDVPKKLIPLFSSCDQNCVFGFITIG